MRYWNRMLQYRDFVRCMIGRVCGDFVCGVAGREEGSEYIEYLTDAMASV